MLAENTINYKLHNRVVFLFFYQCVLCCVSVAEAHTLVVIVDSFCTIPHLQRSL